MANAGMGTGGCSECPGCSCTITGTFSSLSGTQNLGSNPMTATGAGAVLYSGAPASFTDPIYLCVTVRTDDDPATKRIVFNRADANNYHFVEIKVATTVVTAQFGSVIAGTSRYSSSPIEITGGDLATETTFCICFRPGDAQSETSDFQTRFATLADDDSGGWTDKGNIFQDDGLVATTTPASDTPTDGLIAYGFGFSVPAGSVIDGLEFSAGVEHETDDGDVQDAAMTYATSTETSDDMAGDDTVPDAGSNGSQSWGGAASLSGASPTWDEISDTQNFVFRMVWAGVGTVGSSPLSVDHVTATVHYTRPPYEPATVLLSVDGTCVATTRLAYIGSGTGVGLTFVSGNWEFSDFSLSYAESDSRPSCPACCTTTDIFCECCDSPLVSQYLVDLGTTGFADSGCNCDEVTGAFVVDYEAGAGQSFCGQWVYSNSGQCNLLIVLHIGKISDTECVWWLAVVTDEGYAEYRSDPFALGECPTGEITLDSWWTFANVCGAAPPSAVTIEAV